MNQLLQELSERHLIPIKQINDKNAQHSKLTTLSTLLLLPNKQQRQLLQYLLSHVTDYNHNVLQHLLWDYNTDIVYNAFIISDHPFTRQNVLFDISLHTLQLVSKLQFALNIPIINIDAVQRKLSQYNDTLTQQICYKRHNITRRLQQNNIYSKYYAIKPVATVESPNSGNDTSATTTLAKIDTTIKKRTYDQTHTAQTTVIPAPVVNVLNELKQLITSLDNNSINILCVHYTNKHTDTNKPLTTQRDISIAQQLQSIVDAFDTVYNDVFVLICQRIYDWRLNETQLQLLHQLYFTFELSQTRASIWLHNIIVRNVHNFKQTTILHHCLITHLRATCSTIIVPWLLSSYSAAPTANKKQKLKHEHATTILIKTIRSSKLTNKQLQIIVEYVLDYTVHNEHVQWSELVYTFIHAVLTELSTDELSISFNNNIRVLISTVNRMSSIDVNICKSLSLARLIQLLLSKFASVLSNNDTVLHVIERIDNMLKIPLQTAYSRLKQS